MNSNQATKRGDIMGLFFCKGCGEVETTYRRKNSELCDKCIRVRRVTWFLLAAAVVCLVSFIWEFGVA